MVRGFKLCCSKRCVRLEQANSAVTSVCCLHQHVGRLLDYYVEVCALAMQTATLSTEAATQLLTFLYAVICSPSCTFDVYRVSIPALCAAQQPENDAISTVPRLDCSDLASGCGLQCESCSAYHSMLLNTRPPSGKLFKDNGCSGHDHSRIHQVR